MYPEVSDDCVECGLCLKVCPELNILKPTFEQEQQYVEPSVHYYMLDETQDEFTRCHSVKR